MINLAGVDTCDTTIKSELKEAGIEVVEIGKMNREVPATIIGKCNNFIFKRAWYYWVVEGHMPLEHANYIYENYRHLQVRVNGNHEDTTPSEWCIPRGFDEYVSSLFRDKVMKKLMTHEELENHCNELRNKGEQFVLSYHIDTQEGLNEFIKVIKENNIIG